MLTLVLDTLILVALVTLLPLVFLILVFLAKTLTQSRNYPFKRLRYEAGNIPHGHARQPMLPQYYGYILLFIVLDPMFIIMFLASYMVNVDPLAVLIWLTLAVTIVLPPLIYALKYASHIEYWLEAEREYD